MDVSLYPPQPHPSRERRTSLDQRALIQRPGRPKLFRPPPNPLPHNSLLLTFLVFPFGEVKVSPQLSARDLPRLSEEELLQVLPRARQNLGIDIVRWSGKADDESPEVPLESGTRRWEGGRVCRVRAGGDWGRGAQR